MRRVNQHTGLGRQKPILTVSGQGEQILHYYIHITAMRNDLKTQSNNRLNFSLQLSGGI